MSVCAGYTSWAEWSGGLLGALNLVQWTESSWILIDYALSKGPASLLLLSLCNEHKGSFVGGEKSVC